MHHDLNDFTWMLSLRIPCCNSRRPVSFRPAGLSFREDKVHTELHYQVLQHSMLCGETIFYVRNVDLVHDCIKEEMPYVSSAKKM
jgi:hypothetical protein